MAGHDPDLQLARRVRRQSEAAPDRGNGGVHAGELLTLSPGRLRALTRPARLRRRLGRFPESQIVMTPSARIDQTHASDLSSWIESARGDPSFPIQNPPLGTFAPANGSPHPGEPTGREAHRDGSHRVRRPAKPIG